MITSLVKQLSRSTIRTATTSTGWLKQGFSGLGQGAFVGFGVYSELMSTGKEYGAGAGVIRGVSYTLPYVGMAMMVYDTGKMLGDAAYQNQMAKRRSSFTRGSVDPFGNSATMRQRSQYNLNRGRSSLGSEGFLFH